VAIALNLKVVSQHFLGELLVTSIRIAGCPEDIQNRNFPDTNQIL
jgi:hypothetical protein